MSEEISVSETSLMKVGAVGVDSGRIMLLDPCNEGKRTSDVECEYLPGVRIVLRDEIPLGVIVATPGGDGVFPVIAEIVDGKLNGLLLDFGDEDLEKGILGARMIARGEEAPEIVGLEPPLTDEQRDQLRRYVGAHPETPVEGKVPSGTRELRVVLEDVTEVDKPPEYRFVEIDNQDGASVGFPMVNSSTGSLKEIVIPYGRDDAWVSEVAYQVAGAATRPLLEDHPSYVFPAERVRDAVAGLLSDFGIPRACADCAEEEIGHGAKEAGDRRDATIKQLEAEAGRLLTGREEARAGEGHWKAQRDAAFRLLQWVLPDLMRHPSDTLGADLADDAPEEDREAAPDVPDHLALSERARAALSTRIEEGRCNAESLIEIARLA